MHEVVARGAVQVGAALREQRKATHQQVLESRAAQSASSAATSSRTSGAMRRSSGTRASAHRDRMQAASWRQPRSKRGSRMEASRSTAAARIAVVQSAQVGAESLMRSRGARRPHLVLTRVWLGRRRRCSGLLRSQEMWVAGAAGDGVGEVVTWMAVAWLRWGSLKLPSTRVGIVCSFGEVRPAFRNGDTSTRAAPQGLFAQVSRSEGAGLLPVPSATGAIAFDHAGQVVGAVVFGEGVVEEGLDLAARVQRRLGGVAGPLGGPGRLPEPLGEQRRVVVLPAHRRRCPGSLGLGHGWLLLLLLVGCQGPLVAGPRG